MNGAAVRPDLFRGSASTSRWSGWWQTGAQGLNNRDGLIHLQTKHAVCDLDVRSSVVQDLIFSFSFMCKWESGKVEELCSLSLKQIFQSKMPFLTFTHQFPKISIELAGKWDQMHFNMDINIYEMSFADSNS